MSKETFKGDLRRIFSLPWKSQDEAMLLADEDSTLINMEGDETAATVKWFKFLMAEGKKRLPSILKFFWQTLKWHLLLFVLITFSISPLFIFQIVVDNNRGHYYGYYPNTLETTNGIWIPATIVMVSYVIFAVVKLFFVTLVRNVEKLNLKK